MSAAATATTRSARRLDARSLARDIARRIDGEVRFGAGTRALYANDASSYRQVPIGVVIPRTLDDVVATVETCREHDAPIFARGTGTGLAGQSVNDAVLIDFTKYLNEIVELDYERRWARVLPGVICDQLRDAAERHHLTYGPDPATHSRCTLGGMIGNNSCGVHSIMAGVTADNVDALDVLLYDGTRLRVSRGDRAIEGPRAQELTRQLIALRDRYADLIRERYPRIPRRISGYNLERLLPENGFDVAAALVGTESTCAITLQADCKLVPSPQHRALVLLGYDQPWTAADHVPEIMKFEPIGLETFDRRLVNNELEKGFQRHTELLPDGDAWLLVEFGADSKDEADAQAERLMKAFKKGEHKDIKLYEDEREEKEIWEIREGGVGHSKIPGKHPGWPSWEDAAVAPEDIGRYLRDFEQLVSEHGLRVAAYFGHVGHGCIHTRLNWDFSTQEGVRRYRAFMEDAADLVARYHGSLSGEHGDGHARAELLPKMFGDELVQAFREFKAIWDPDGKMNPGKVSDPYPLDRFLRTGPDYRPAQVQTHFRFPSDAGSLVEASERCFGVGKCREIEAGDDVMCPSFRATREELHSTRGRARMLFEMLRGDVITDGWHSDDVKESLDLCLACKGCKHDCPVRVDMATYKAEFFSHYYERKLRPLSHYALGLIYWEARLASHVPRLANKLAKLGKPLVGIASERELPQFAPFTFRDWWRSRAVRPAAPGATRVLFWPDTFNTYFRPQTAIAAVHVLEAAGCRVEIPERVLCCGRPLYDFGMLDLAKRQLRQILDALRPQLEAGVPVVGLEPSCVAVFRDELCELFPDSGDAKRLREQSYALSEFLTKLEWTPPQLEGRALVQAHCHHKSLLGFDDERELLEKVGLDVEVLASGCCGMAGSFGYEAGEKYEVSMRCAEDVLLPKVRESGENAFVLADGFSCRSQIEHGSDRRALHVAEVLQLALRATDGAAASPNGSRKDRRLRATGTIALAGAGLVAGSLLLRRR